MMKSSFFGKYPAITIIKSSYIQFLLYQSCIFIFWKKIAGVSYIWQCLSLQNLIGSLWAEWVETAKKKIACANVIIDGNSNI